MNDETELTVSEQKTKKMLYEVVGRKIAESRKSSRRKLEGISKKLNISVDILKKIESGTIHEINSDIPVTGFVRAYAKFTKNSIVDLETDGIDLLGKGFFAVLIDQGQGTKPYQGITPLSGRSLSDCAKKYFGI